METAYIAKIAIKPGIPIEHQCKTYGVLEVNRDMDGRPCAWVRCIGSRDGLLRFAEANGVHGAEPVEVEAVTA